MRLPKLKVGDQLYVTYREGLELPHAGKTCPITITSITRDDFFCVSENGRPHGVSRRALREYGQDGDMWFTITIDPPGPVQTQASSEPVHVADGVH